MITLWAFNAMAFLCNWMLVSSSALKDDNSLRIFKESPNEFEYVVKRHDVDDRKEDVESKERRSTMGGSSFIRFGRGFNTMDNSAFDNEIDSKGINRHPRWKSPDVVIRLGRSGNKATNNEQPKRGKNDLNFIRKVSKPEKWTMTQQHNGFTGDSYLPIVVFFLRHDIGKFSKHVWP
ncbi:FMRFamide-related peptides-like isoform X2 [Nylanderia fulva]|uniref:FMRFamide-related peptides-like isoform X2 n=1 Tax=Nylanderia fulva TaxID=613905 RepID=UPI0010FB823E|nr:FMRFamide-related peptides-like isoform X2 [Nylanderia fulva]